jgi:signal transduction histidine kinase
MTAIMDELRPPIHAALEDTESLTQVIEGALVDLTGAITQFRCSQRRIQGQVDSLRWLPALLQGNPVQLPKPAPCRLGSILSAITGSARYLQMDVPGDLHILAPLGVFDIALERLLYAVRHLAGPKTPITVRARAIDATQKTWPASASVTLAGPTVLLTVTAASPYIPNDVRSHLLQLLHPVAEDAPGLGFGLWLSRRLACSQGGDLWLDESAGGTTFHSIWPLCRKARLR